MIIKVKNADSVTRTWCGQEITSGSYYELEQVEISKWANDDSVLESISDGDLIVNNGTSDISGTSKQIDYLKYGCTLDNDGVPIYTLKAANTDGRSMVHASPRIRGTYTYYAGSDDDHTDPTKVGGTSNVEKLRAHHEVGDDSEEILYFDLNTITNKTFIHEGFMQWKDALNDTITMEIVPQVTAYTSGSNTNFNLYGGYLIIPASGNGTIAVDSDDMRLVECTPNEYGIKPAGYWNATFNASTKEFESITAAPYGDGNYNMFGTEVKLFRFANQLSFLGSGVCQIQSEDATQIGHGMRFKMTWKTEGTDHEWWWNLTLSMYRKKTV
jgi:hypothetical protein